MYRKLITDLKIPFEINDVVRKEDTQIYVSLREALVNTLVHADFTGRASILSRLTSRTPQNLRQSHLKEMVDKGVLSLAFPNKPHSPKQGYTVLDK